MRIIRVCTAALARFLMSAIFLSSAIKNIFYWHEVEGNLMTALCEWQAYVGFSEVAQNCFNILTPWAPLLLIVATLFLLGGGLLLLLGVREKLGATLLIFFLIPATLLYHSFWFMEGTVRDLQTIMFLKNLAILGGLLLVLLHGGQERSGNSDNFPSMTLG